MASADRKKAIEATRENGVVVAGAGTGKTTLLTERVLRLILHDGIPVQKIACLTFTEKAAGEMRERISKALLEARSKELEAASAALEHLSASQIDTIHGFCAHLLRLYPLEAGVDPAFKIDQGENWQTLFEERYNAWLSEELGEYSAHETEWLELLRTVELKEIRELAEAITRFHVPIEKLNPSPLNPPLTLALSLKGRGDSSLLFLLSRLVPFAYQFRKSFLELGYVSFDALLVLARNLVRDHWRIREELKVRYPAILVDEFQDTDPLQAELLLYLAEEIDGGAKHWSEVKPGPGRLFIVGDPKQSIYRFRGADIAAFERVRAQLLGSGGFEAKLTTNFRSENGLITLFNEIFSKVLVEKEGVQAGYIPLSSRGDADPLNRREIARKGLDERSLAPSAEQQELGMTPPTELWLIRSDDADKPLSADDAREIEAREIAKWINQQASSFELPASSPQYGNIAILLRTFSSLRIYLQELRRAGIPYAVEEDRYFYTTPEILDLTNFLEAVHNPSNRLALWGFLRSPLAGIQDGTLFLLAREKSLNYFAPLPKNIPDAAILQTLFDLLKSCHERLKREPLPDFLEHVFEHTHFLAMEAGSFYGEQAVANWKKYLRLIRELSLEEAASLPELLRRIRSRLANGAREGESPVAEEKVNAVRILTVHKSKGLEFPVVILPDLHGGRRSFQTEPVEMRWQDGKVGLRLGKTLKNPEMDELAPFLKEAELEESRRVFYVAMTRAQKRLILSGRADKFSKGSFFADLEKGLGQSVSELQDGRGKAGDAEFLIRDIRPEKKKKAKAPVKPKTAALGITPEKFSALWKTRTEEAEQVNAVSRFITPSHLEKGLGVTGHGAREKTWSPSDDTDLPPDARTLLGTLCHRVLEHHHFEKPEVGSSKLEALIRKFSGPLLATAPHLDTNRIQEEAGRILTAFVQTGDYKEIADSEILGREVPFIYNPSSFKLPASSSTIMRGTIDILYRKRGGTLVVGDYKLKARGADEYQAQGQAYLAALTSFPSERRAFKIISLDR